MKLQDLKSIITSACILVYLPDGTKLHFQSYDGDYLHTGGSMNYELYYEFGDYNVTQIYTFNGQTMIIEITNKKKGMKLRDKYGYPIEVVKGKYIHNFLRYLLITNIKETYHRRHK
jgi:hypothetical protein